MEQTLSINVDFVIIFISGFCVLLRSFCLVLSLPRLLFCPSVFVATVGMASGGGVAMTTTPTSPQFGLGPPVSLEGPGEADLQRTEQLRLFLESQGMFEPIEESQRREEVLGRMDALCKQAVAKVSVRMGFSEAEAYSFGVRIYTFGSFRLGVHASGADIDTLCIGPKHVDRQAFFLELVSLLKQVNDISEVDAVLDAVVPIVKVRFLDIDLDIQYAHLTYARIPDNFDILDPEVRRNCHETSVDSLAGPQNANQILRLVPNQESFRLALRAIKLWASNRGVYSNKVGYPGGIALAILIARVCQLWPNASASMLVHRFFILYHRWKWPLPIMLRPLPPPTPGVRCWNPKFNPGDARQLMPVITPAEPCINSTFNVSRSTLRILRQEWERGEQITNELIEGKRSWGDLFEKSDFFYRYKTYLQVSAGAQNEDDARRWMDFVESRLRFLLRGFEDLDVIRAHIFPDKFALRDSGIPNCQAMYIGLEFEKPKLGVAKEVDISNTIALFEQKLDWPGRTPSMIRPKFEAVKPSQIPESVRPRKQKKRDKKRDESEEGEKDLCKSAEHVVEPPEKKKKAFSKVGHGVVDTEATELVDAARESSVVSAAASAMSGASSGPLLSEMSVSEAVSEIFGDGSAGSTKPE